MQIGEQDVLRMVKEQGLPARRVGKEWRLLKAAIQDWLRAATAALSADKDFWETSIGAWKDDPDAEAIVREICKRRGRPMTEER